MWKLTGKGEAAPTNTHALRKSIFRKVLTLVWRPPGYICFYSLLFTRKIHLIAPLASATPVKILLQRPSAANAFSSLWKVPWSAGVCPDTTDFRSGSRWGAGCSEHAHTNFPLGIKHTWAHRCLDSGETLSSMRCGVPAPAEVVAECLWIPLWPDSKFVDERLVYSFLGLEF